ncbi:MAG: hypothetical protein DSY35_01935 [Desulfurobacterium sp.]|nr:MAG: hypothetical protein DSY35_01935 [Desulfurobacterium sp.]
MKDRIKEEIRLYENLFNKAFSVTVLVGVGTLAVLRKEGFGFWAGTGVIALYFSLVFLGLTLKKWKDKIASLEGLDDNSS